MRDPMGSAKMHRGHNHSRVHTLYVPHVCWFAMHPCPHRRAASLYGWVHICILLSGLWGRFLGYGFFPLAVIFSKYYWNQKFLIWPNGRRYGVGWRKVEAQNHHQSRQWKKNPTTSSLTLSRGHFLPADQLWAENLSLITLDTYLFTPVLHQSWLQLPQMPLICICKC